MCYVMTKQWPVTVPIHPNSVSILKSFHVTQYSAAALFNCKYIDCLNVPSFNLDAKSVTG